jgi:hypothetical protein
VGVRNYLWGKAMSDADAVVVVRVDSARQAIALLRRGHGQGLTMLTAGEVTIDADAAQIPVGIDGETVMLPTRSGASSSRGRSG